VARVELVAVEQSHRRVEPSTTTMSRRHRRVPAVLLVIVGALASRREELLTPKIGTREGLTCGPSLVKKRHSAGKSP
jgi:hypothetical protein